jgi:peptidoglycan/xylan/chitin deacetylase (PgdA/CDA1 family)
MVSLDFELFWGMLEVCSLESYQDNVLGGKKAIPELLELFEKYGIHATWATVGYLFAENKEELKRFFPDRQMRPSYADPRLDPYTYLETIGDNEEQAPCFYCPDLIRLVANTPGQEIGSHTFCHYYCWAEGQTVEQFAADMKAAKVIAEEKRYEVTSVVLPRNQCAPEYTKVLADLGYTAFRDLEQDWVHRKVPVRILERACILLDAYLPLTKGTYRPQKELGIWNFTGAALGVEDRLPVEEVEFSQSLMVLNYRMK